VHGAANDLRPSPKGLALGQAPKALVKAGAASPHHAFIQIRNQVNNWKNHDITNPDVLEFIRMQKELLSSDEKITCAWIKKHPEKVVKYYFHILKYLEQHTETKKFTLTPISK
jgi:hypothetical protein